MLREFEDYLKCGGLVNVLINDTGALFPGAAAAGATVIDIGQHKMRQVNIYIPALDNITQRHFVLRRRVDA